MDNATCGKISVSDVALASIQLLGAVVCATLQVIMHQIKARVAGGGSCVYFTT